MIEKNARLKSPIFRKILDALTVYSDHKQILISTLNPYFLDLFGERIDEVVIVENDKMNQLSEYRSLLDLNDGSPLGEIWFSGLLDKKKDENEC